MAKGKDAVEASRVQIGQWTGLAWDTIKKYMPTLMEEKLVQLVRSATSISPAMYEIYWLPPPVALDSGTPPETIGCYVDQFTKEDRAEYQRLAQLLTGEERQQLHSEISWSLRDLGIPWNYGLIKKCVMWQFLIRPLIAVTWKPHTQNGSPHQSCKPVKPPSLFSPSTFIRSR